jgi:hypothetical protein
MVDPISNAPSASQIGPAQRRSRASSDSLGAQSARDSVQRVEALRAAVEELIKKISSKDPRFASLSHEQGSAGSSDAVGNDGDAQWPPRQLLRHYLSQMEGLLLDPEA